MTRATWREGGGEGRGGGGGAPPEDKGHGADGMFRPSWPRLGGGPRRKEGKFKHERRRSSVGIEGRTEKEGEGREERDSLTAQDLVPFLVPLHGRAGPAHGLLK
jgi:hypothetical protein